MKALQYIKQTPSLKRYVHYLLVSPQQARPRTWVSWLVNPFIHQRHRTAVVRPTARLDVLPFRAFELGPDAVIEDYAVINNGVGDVRIGEQTFVGIGSVIIGPVQIGKQVIVAQHVVISALNHGYEDVSTPISLQPITTRPITIDDESWIGANVVITAGVRIGRHAVVAGGSVVTKDVPPYSVVAGNPAQVIKYYDVDQKIWCKVPRP